MKQLLFLVLLLYICPAHAQEIPRKAVMGANGTFSAAGMAIDTVWPNATFAAVGLRKGDTLLSINNTPIKEQGSFNAVATTIRKGDKVSLSYKRNGKTLQKAVNATVRPWETSELATISYDWVNYKSCKLRTITRRPLGKNHTPAVLLIPGYNCGSIENFSQGIYKHLLEAWLKAGYTVVTIEKSGLGDSYNCIPCSEADLVTDIQTFDAGYNYMHDLPFVDTNKLLIWGHSMGGVIAPEIAKLHRPKGVIVFATVFRPWSEFLLEMHRVQAPLDGKSYVETEAFVRQMQKIYYEFFILKKSPEELHDNPEYKELAVSELNYKPGGTDMWGRHWRYWQQIDSLNLAKSWGQVNCPVLSIFGGADHVACSLFEHQLIERTVNAAQPDRCTHITIPDIDHLLTRNTDWQSSHKNWLNKAYMEANFHYGFTDTLVSWMNRIVAN